MDILDIPTRAHVGANIDWLATRLYRGPRTMRRRLASWARDYAAEDPRSLAPDCLRDVMKCLVTLAHANASVALVEPPKGVFAQLEVIFADVDGYGACLFSLVNVLDSLPLPEEEIVELQDFARKFRAEQEEQIRQGLLGYELKNRPRH